MPLHIILPPLFSSFLYNLSELTLLTTRTTLFSVIITPAPSHTPHYTFSQPVVSASAPGLPKESAAQLEGSRNDDLVHDLTKPRHLGQGTQRGRTRVQR